MPPIGATRPAWHADSRCNALMFELC